jgi:hypothetical protein
MFFEFASHTDGWLKIYEDDDNNEENSMLKQTNLFFLSIFLLLLALSSRGQIADVSYPFSVECSENPLQAGEAAIFTGKFSPQVKSDGYSFNWTTTAGQLIQGQGTPTIMANRSADFCSAAENREG